MKYSTAKKYITGFKSSVLKRNGVLDRDKLKEGLRRYEELLKSSGLLGKY